MVPRSLGRRTYSHRERNVVPSTSGLPSTPATTITPPEEPRGFPDSDSPPFHDQDAHRDNDLSLLPFLLHWTLTFQALPAVELEYASVVYSSLATTTLQPLPSTSGHKMGELCESPRREIVLGAFATARIGKWVVPPVRSSPSRMCYRHGLDLEAKFVAGLICTRGFRRYTQLSTSGKFTAGLISAAALDMKIRSQIRLRHCKIDRYSPETS
ncbi:hypothetical protein B0H17DRAFT_1251594 [Mycena rosella]|uniref:Uncharacterized protein n=1 Tax=Mycena rosella TaxID=1033263 RepID=A0AAD7D0L5_MYCRO|nr:hypothetical protein B0H17DRAFT_1251594 [Mycena rosella]